MATSDDPHTKFGLTCPSNGTFYICQDTSTRFIGCCNVDPCTRELDGDCPKSKLYKASYSASSGVELLPQDCADHSNGGSWYTCDHAVPPFLGCCINNPCNNGCLEGNLVAAKLSDDPENASQLMVPETTVATATTSASSSSTSSSTTGSSTDNSSPSSMDDDSARAGLIAGISVAGVVILLLVIAAYLWFKRRERSRRKSEYAPELAHNDPSKPRQPNELFRCK